jgi:hypothetical protein
LKVGAGGLDLGDAQREVPRAGRVRPVLEQQVDVLVAQVEPDDDEVERPRLGNLLQAEHVAVEPPAPLHVGDDDRNMVELCHLETGHG